MTKLRAIETRRSIVRNTHPGYSGVIDANGQAVQLNDREELDVPWLVGAAHWTTASAFIHAREIG